MTDGKDETWSPAKMSVARRWPGSVVADCSTPALSGTISHANNYSNISAVKRHVANISHLTVLSIDQRFTQQILAQVILKRQLSVIYLLTNTYLIIVIIGS